MIDKAVDADGTGSALSRALAAMPRRKLVLVDDDDTHDAYCKAFDAVRAAGMCPGHSEEADHLYIVTLARIPAVKILDAYKKKGVLGKLGEGFRADLRLMCDAPVGGGGGGAAAAGAGGRGGGAGAAAAGGGRGGGGGGSGRGVSVFYVGETTRGATERAKAHRSSGKYLACLHKDHGGELKTTVVIEITDDVAAVLAAITRDGKPGAVSPTCVRLQSEAVAVAILMSRTCSRGWSPLTNEHVGVNRVGGGFWGGSVYVQMHAAAKDPVLGQVVLTRDSTQATMIDDDVPTDGE